MKNLLETLAELERLEKEATPGPAESTSIVEYRVDNGVSFALVYLPTIEEMGSVIQCMTIKPVEDARLIAKSRNALPILISALREAVDLFENKWQEACDIVCFGHDVCDCVRCNFLEKHGISDKAKGE